MFFHFVAILSNFSKGRRIAWHYASEGKPDKNRIKVFMQNVERRCGDVQLGIHRLSTDSADWTSIVQKDSFFADIFVTNKDKDFITLVNADKKLTAYDVAKFILSIVPVSHLKLQKLLYYCYADYLVKTGEKLFDDPIVAYKYGPVVENIFYKFKRNGSSPIDFVEDSSFSIMTTQITPTFVKTVSSEDGIKAAACIIKVIKDYSPYDAMDLVKLTHQSGGPWHRVYKPGQNKLISDEVIKEFHDAVTA